MADNEKPKKNQKKPSRESHQRSISSKKGLTLDDSHLKGGIFEAAAEMAKKMAEGGMLDGREAEKGKGDSLR